MPSGVRQVRSLPFTSLLAAACHWARVGLSVMSLAFEDWGALLAKCGNGFGKIGGRASHTLIFGFRCEGFFKRAGEASAELLPDKPERNRRPLGKLARQASRFVHQCLVVHGARDQADLLGFLRWDLVAG